MNLGPSYIGEKGYRIVKLRRIFAGLLTALLFCVTSWAAACDLSCGFALFQTDCHLSRPETRNSMPAGTKMDGAMEGMSMPDMGDGGARNQQSLSVASLGMAGHAAIDAIGPCERQSCDLETVAAARATPTGHHSPILLSSLQVRPNLLVGFKPLFTAPKTTMPPLAHANVVPSA